MFYFLSLKVWLLNLKIFKKVHKHIQAKKRIKSNKMSNYAKIFTDFFKKLNPFDIRFIQQEMMLTSNYTIVNLEDKEKINNVFHKEVLNLYQ